MRVLTSIIAEMAGDCAGATGGGPQARTAAAAAGNPSVGGR